MTGVTIAQSGDNVTVVQGVAAAGPPGAAGSLTGTAGGDLTGTYPNPTIGTGKVTSTNILDGTIVNADISASAAIALSKLANIGTARILGNNTGSSGPPIELTAAQVKTLLAITSADLSDFASAAYSSAQTFNSQSGTTYTLVLGDAGKLVELSNAAAITVTVPTNALVAFAVGTRIDLAQQGAGQVTVSPAGGVTIRSTPGAKTRAQYSGATLVKRATDEWYLFGDLAA